MSHFDALQTLGTFEKDGNEFELNREEITFAISNSVPFPFGPHGETIDVDDAEPFFMDSKLTHLPNFDFLPPENLDGTAYGLYEDIRSLKRETLDDIKLILGPAGFSDVLPEELGRGRANSKVYRTDKAGDFDVINRRKLTSPAQTVFRDYQTVYFDKTSDQNNLIMQMFEDGPNSKLQKLDIIDAGSFYDEESELYPEKRVFYAGKVYFDSLNTPTFINLFTIIFE